MADNQSDAAVRAEKKQNSQERRGRSANVRQGRKGTRTRQMIKQAVAQLLIEKDVSNIVLDDICKATGLTVGAFYFHFKNKDAALEEVAIDSIEQFYLGFRNISGQDDSVRAELRDIMALLIRTVSDHPQLVRLVFNVVPLSADARKVWWEHHDLACRRLARLISQLKGQDAPNREDEMAVQFMMLGMESYLENALSGREPGASIFKNDPVQFTNDLMDIWRRVFDPRHEVAAAA